MTTAKLCHTFGVLVMLSLLLNCGPVDDGAVHDASAHLDAYDADSEESLADSDIERRADGQSTRSSPRLDWAWDEPGPYRVGHRTLVVSYLPVATGEPREIPLQLWYPTEATSGEPVLYLDAFTDDDALGSAPLAAALDGRSLPLHVHTHGNLGWGGLADHIAARFASHGWVIAAPDHLGNTLIDNVRNGDVPAWVWPVRVEDVRASLDHLAALPEADPLHGRIDLEHVLLSGHSYGGAATFWLSGATLSAERVEVLCGNNGGCTEEEKEAFALTQVDPRIAATISMAPGDSELFSGPGLATMTVPLLHMTDDDDRPVDNAAYWDQAPTGANRLHIEGACHTTYTLGGCPDFDTALGLQIVNTYAMAFARYHILGDRDPTLLALLSGEDVIDPSSTLTVKGD